jgi:hypothetical protein
VNDQANGDAWAIVDHKNNAGVLIRFGPKRIERIQYWITNAFAFQAISAEPTLAAGEGFDTS